MKFKSITVTQRGGLVVLNYIVAYQCLYRSAKVKDGDKVLIIGDSGGIGTSLLQLGKLANLTMYGTASKSKHKILKKYGTLPVDYHTDNVVDFIKQTEPGGLDAVFNGMGAEYIDRGLSVLKRGGKLVGYGNPMSISGMWKLLGKTVLTNFCFNGKSAVLYGTGAHYFNMKPFLEDWAALFKLLEDGKIKPVIAKTYPLMEAVKANQLLESGQIVGNIVLASPEYL